MVPRLASFCYRRRRWVLLSWVVAFVALGVVVNSLGSAFSQQFNLGNRDSQVAQDLLTAHFPARSGAAGAIVFKADAGVDDPSVQAAMTQLFDEVAQVPQVAGVRSPYTEAGASQISGNGTIAYADVQFDADWQDVDRANIDQIRSMAANADIPGVQVELGGEVFQPHGSLGHSELIGLAAAAVILLVAFGSVLAMGLPILMALFGVGVGLSLVQLLAHVMSVPDFSTQLGSMIGIGVGIDYALFIVTRYRQSLREGLDPHAATVTALNTSGRAVIFAGMTVVISLAGMLLIPLEFVKGLGLSAALVVLATMVASVTLLPAMLGFVGHNIDRLALPWSKRPKPDGHRTIWVRWSGVVSRHPWPIALAGLGALLVMSIPVLSLQLGWNDTGNLPTSETVRRAYDLKAEGFGAGGSAPILLVAELPAGDTTESLAPLVDQVRGVDGVAQVSPPSASPDGSVAVVTVIPTTSLQDPATATLLRHLRDDVIPAFDASSGITVHAGGLTASSEDVTDLLSGSLPIFIATVLALSFLLLLVVFRSVLVPLKAVLMNLLSIGAAYGLIVAVFQWGWFAGVFGLGKTGPIQNFLPMMMFAVLFGLSMDYEVFLLSRIKEEWDRTDDNSAAVSEGLSHTARVITAAALIMVCVFGSFMLVDNRVVKMFGLGLAAAVLIDATVVRIVLVPATMELLGRANWWFPRWLRWLPEVHVDGNEVSTGLADIDVRDGDEPDEDREPVLTS